MVADVSIHRDVKHNPHAHIMLTVRPFDEGGKWGKKKEREYIKDENDNFEYGDNGKKKFRTVHLTDWDRKETLLEWRKNFAEKVNQYYKEFKIDESVSHESYEKQGLSRIPKHRLSRNEYFIEQIEKKNAENNNFEYIPVTYYAQLNHDIDKTNTRFEKLNEQVIELKEYREKVKNELLQGLEAIRNNVKLSSEDWEAIKILVARGKGYANYDIAKDTVKRVEFWKRKLEKQKVDITSYGKVLEKAKTVFKDNPKEVLMYGFIPSEFEKQYSIKEKEFKAMVEDYNKKTNAYNELNQHTRRAYSIQKSLVDKEFKLLYPHYGGYLSNNNKASDLKSYYVDLFKKEGVIRNEITELEENSNKYSDLITKSESLLEDWKENANSLMILERTKKKQQNEFKNQFNKWKSEEVFNLSVKFTNTIEQIKERESAKEKLSVKVDELLKVIYPDLREETLSQLTAESKARILELNVNGESTRVFTTDMLSLEKDIKADLHKINPKDIKHNGPFKTSASGSAGDLFNSVLFSAQQNQNSYDDLEKRRRRTKKRNKKWKKNYSNIGENEV